METHRSVTKSEMPADVQQKKLAGLSKSSETNAAISNSTKCTRFQPIKTKNCSRYKVMNG